MRNVCTSFPNMLTKIKTIQEGERGLGGNFKKIPPFLVWIMVGVDQGKTLQDFTALKEYKIKDGDKVNCIREIMSEIRIRSRKVFEPWSGFAFFFLSKSWSVICFFPQDPNPKCFFLWILICNIFSLWILICKDVYFYLDPDPQCFFFLWILIRNVFFLLWILIRNVFNWVIWIRNMLAPWIRNKQDFYQIKCSS